MPKAQEQPTVKSLEIQVWWISGSKSWIIRSMLGGKQALPNRRVDSDYHGAPDLADLRHLISAIEAEMQRWLG